MRHHTFAALAACILSGTACAADSTAAAGGSAITAGACPNLPGYRSTTPPQGMAIDAMGNCVPQSSAGAQKKLYSGTGWGTLSTVLSGVWCYSADGICPAYRHQLNMDVPIVMGALTLNSITGAIVNGYSYYETYVWNAWVLSAGTSTIPACASVKINGVLLSGFGAQSNGLMRSATLHNMFETIPDNSRVRVDVTDCELVQRPYTGYPADNCFMGDASAAACSSV